MVGFAEVFHPRSWAALDRGLTCLEADLPDDDGQSRVHQVIPPAHSNTRPAPDAAKAYSFHSSCVWGL